MKLYNKIENLLTRVRSLLFKNIVKDCGKKIIVGKDITINSPHSLHIGNNVSIGKHTFFLPCDYYAGVKYTPNITIGDGCHIGIRNSFACVDRIIIGKNVLFAGYVHITDHSHGYEDVARPITPQQLVCKGPVIIEDDCWLGFSCEILSGVHIGKHCIVAARAVVTKDVPAYSIVAGNPARIVKQFNFETKKWEKVKK